MNHVISGYVSVQPDWELLLLPSDSTSPAKTSFWVSAYRGEDLDVHCDVQVLRGEDGGVTGVTSDNKEIDVSLLVEEKGHALQVTCGAVGASSVVRGPSRTLSSLHKKNASATEAKQVGFVPFKEIFDFDINMSTNRGVSGSQDGDLKLWNVQDPVSGGVVQLVGHLGDVNLCQFFPDPELVLSAADDKTIKIWACENGQCALTLNKTRDSKVDDDAHVTDEQDIAQVRHTRRVTMLSIVGQGAQIVSAAVDGTVLCWDVAKQHPVSGVRPGSSAPVICGCALGNDAFATGCDDGRLRIYDFRSPSPSSSNGPALGASSSMVIKLDQMVSITSCEVYLEGDRSLMLGTEEGQVLLFDLRKSDAPLFPASSKSCGAIHTLAVSSDGKVWSGHHEGDVSRWDLPSRTIEVELTGADCIPINRLRSLADNEIYAASTELRHYAW